MIFGPVEIHIHNHPSGIDSTQLQQELQAIMGKTQIAIEKIEQVSNTLDKVSGETTALVQEVRDLRAAAEEEGVSDELMAKIEALGSKADGIDQLVDDVAPNPTPTPPEPTE